MENQQSQPTEWKQLIGDVSEFDKTSADYLHSLEVATSADEPTDPAAQAEALSEIIGSVEAHQQAVDRLLRETDVETRPD